uniref:Zinc finger and BTB domain containing 39 n=1 Tax=Crocodylus porosus TaxID=8502 RepID=A0A7M4ER89_CROPO
MCTCHPAVSFPLPRTAEISPMPMGMRIKLHSTNHPNNLLRELNKCRLSETMCDVTIVVGSRSFAAHKAVLACAAGYFQNLFLAAGLDAARTYVVDFITPANFEKILSFMYTAELFTDLINVGVIYEVAEKLGMEDLLRACHSTFPDLESTAVPKQPSLVAGEGRPGSLGGPSGDPSQPPGDARGSGEPLGSEREELGAPEEVIELSDDSEEELVCETHFQDRNARVTHVLSHIGIFLFSCDMCETKFFTQWQLTLHRREGVADGHVIVHPSDLLLGKLGALPGASGTELACAACGRALPRDFHAVRSHVLEHVNVKGQACGLCDQRHLSLCGLLWHGLSHLGISVFSCSVCANSFVDRHLLEKHMAVHQSLEEALYRCHYCGQSFKLEAAYRYHPGHSKYSCKVCGKRFAHTSEFNYHRRIHTGEKPYQCKVCHKFFRGRSTIKCHLKTHAGALMYRCTVCGHYSSTLNLMSKHIGVHKGSLPPDFTIEQTSHTGTPGPQPCSFTLMGGVAGTHLLWPVGGEQGGHQLDLPRGLLVTAVHQLHVSYLQEGDEAGHEPKAGAEQAAATVLVLTPEGGGAGEGHVAVHTERGEQEDAGVHVGEQHSQVGHGHIEHIEVDQVAARPVLPVDPDHQQVLHQPHHEDEQVEDKQHHPLDILVQGDLTVGEGEVEEVQQLRPVVVVPVSPRHQCPCRRGCHLGHGGGWRDRGT